MTSFVEVLDLADGPRAHELRVGPNACFELLPHVGGISLVDRNDDLSASVSLRRARCVRPSRSCSTPLGCVPPLSDPSDVLHAVVDEADRVHALPEWWNLIEAAPSSEHLVDHLGIRLGFTGHEELHGWMVAHPRRHQDTERGAA
jgi:hypothetical protein